MCVFISVNASVPVQVNVCVSVSVSKYMGKLTIQGVRVCVCMGPRLQDLWAHVHK